VLVCAHVQGKLQLVMKFIVAAVAGTAEVWQQS
jgi:hypothetical protein